MKFTASVIALSLVALTAQTALASKYDFTTSTIQVSQSLDYMRVTVFRTMTTV